MPQWATQWCLSLIAVDYHAIHTASLAWKLKAILCTICTERLIVLCKWWFICVQLEYLCTIKECCISICVYSHCVGLAADKADLKEGDQLVSVNKQDISTLNHEALVAMIKKVSESEYWFTCKLILMEHVRTTGWSWGQCYAWCDKNSTAKGNWWVSSYSKLITQLCISMYMMTVGLVWECFQTEWPVCSASPCSWPSCPALLILAACWVYVGSTDTASVVMLVWIPDGS